MTFNITDTIFSIRKTQKEIIRDWIMFVLGATAIYGILFIGYYSLEVDYRSELDPVHRKYLYHYLVQAIVLLLFGGTSSMNSITI